MFSYHSLQASSKSFATTKSVNLRCSITNLSTSSPSKYRGACTTSPALALQLRIRVLRGQVQLLLWHQCKCFLPGLLQRCTSPMSSFHSSAFTFLIFALAVYIKISAATSRECSSGYPLAISLKKLSWQAGKSKNIASGRFLLIQSKAFSFELLVFTVERMVILLMLYSFLRQFSQTLERHFSMATSPQNKTRHRFPFSLFFSLLGLFSLTRRRCSPLPTFGCSL